MKAVISKRAARAAEHWDKHADYPGVFSREFLEAIDLLERTRGPGAPFPTAKHPELKRLLLRKSGCHIYFEADEPKQMLRILHVWDGRRERPPKL